MQQICIFHVHLDAPPGRPHMLPQRERSMDMDISACYITCMLSFINFTNCYINLVGCLDSRVLNRGYQVSNVVVGAFCFSYSNPLETDSCVRLALTAAGHKQGVGGEICKHMFLTPRSSKRN